MGKTDKPLNRKLLLYISLIFNLGILGFFKYFNFFQENFIKLSENLGLSVNSFSIKILLPVGISFYTFQTLSYTIDIYRKKLEPTRNFIDFAAFVSFFPQLVAGPIERASNLLPQFQSKRKFDYTEARAGLQQVLWGFFKKIVIADNCAHFVDIIFNSPTDYSASTLLVGAFLFAFQIYGDFSGYSDIAIGVARLFGFKLMRNFSNPYFSENIREFWQRWHISLSSWFRDYVYIPLGGNRYGRLITFRNIFLVFLISGFWHGAEWTFIAWGALHGVCYILALRISRMKNILRFNSTFVNLGLKGFKIGLTFSIVCFLWIFFRAEDLTASFRFISEILKPDLFSLPEIKPLYLILLILFQVTVEFLSRKQKIALSVIDYYKSRYIRWACYTGIVVLIGLFMHSKETPFIYFQF
ncbi:MBOAT family O-acyltransferase [Christiangramia salexigens]|uniref:MBOAT family O-acyltransferase n=1 Tax=Christiangramia salexigens TaxID=1913577 RepID=UPI00311AA658